MLFELPLLLLKSNDPLAFLFEHPLFIAGLQAIVLLAIGIYTGIKILDILGWW